MRPPWKRRRRLLIGDAFIRVRQVVPHDIDGVQANEAAVLADHRSDLDHPGVVNGGQFEIAVCLDACPVAFVSASGALTIRPATREEVIEFARVHGGPR